MFSKFIHKILIQYPLVWNTRLIPILIFSVLFHICFFLLGYGSVNSISAFQEYDRSYIKILDSFGIHILGGLILLLALIIWLYYYLRNNAFKSFYPVNKNYLRKEYLMVFFMVFINLTVFHTFYYAKHLKKLHISVHCQPEKEAEIVNLANHFMPFNIESFESYNSCDSQIARSNKIDTTPVIVNDYCQNLFDNPTQNEETHDYSVKPATETQNNTVGVERIKTYSYLNYCHESMPQLSRNGHNEFYFNETANRWLLNDEKDSIRDVLNSYFKLMDQYKARYNVSVDSLVNWCFMTKDHSVIYELNTINYSYNDDIPYVDLNEGEFSNLERAIENVAEERTDTFLNITSWDMYFYFTLGISILLFMFRVTRIKPWLSSIVGMGIWALIFALIAKSSSDWIMVYVFETCILITLFIAYRQIMVKGNKLFSAVWLCWFSFIYLSFIPMAFQIIKDNTGEIRRCINNHWVIVRAEYTIHSWINQHWDIINTMNIFAGLLLMLYVIIPLAYKWQANPSE